MLMTWVLHGPAGPTLCMDRLAPLFAWTSLLLVPTVFSPGGFTLQVHTAPSLHLPLIVFGGNIFTYSYRHTSSSFQTDPRALLMCGASALVHVHGVDYCMAMCAHAQFCMQYVVVKLLQLLCVVQSDCSMVIIKESYTK